MSQVIADQVKKTKVFLSCLRKNMKLLGALDVNLISELEVEINELHEENQEIERIKQATRERVQEANRDLVQVRRKLAELKKNVKKNTRPGKWRTVGILGGRPIFGL
jgi:chromosome segregation ATPase